YSDFNKRWAELFFDASNTFMVSVERLMTLFKFLSDAVDPNDEMGMERQRQVNDLLIVLVENHFRIQRLVVLAPSNGLAADTAARQIVESVANLTKTRMGNLENIRRQI